MNHGLPNWRRFSVVSLFFCMALAGCQQSSTVPADLMHGVPVLPMRTVQLEIRAGEKSIVALHVEIAETTRQRRIGLMGRESLPEDQGMLFLYSMERPGSAPFHMHRTLIPLDIAFFDAQGAIVAILQMQPCTEPVAGGCRKYSPGVPYFGALEVNQGLFAAWGIENGHRVVLVE